MVSAMDNSSHDDERINAFVRVFSGEAPGVGFFKSMSAKSSSTPGSARMRALGIRIKPDPHKKPFCCRAVTDAPLDALRVKAMSSPARSTSFRARRAVSALDVGMTTTDTAIAI